ncbi:MAG: hypothetical protein KF812_03290 [Fimbriimonadaceae bacterium]|nr:hypothetical protein [Fimbriimonadaceae bacterium]
MKQVSLLLIVTLFLVGCSGPAEPQGDPNAQSTTTTGTASEPENIGDGGAIAFEEWNDGVRKGSGTLISGETETKVELATLKLEKDGSFMLSLGNTESGITEVAKLSGTWEKKDDQSVGLTIKEGATEATGTVTFMDQMNPSEIVVNGMQDGKTMAFTFDVAE